MAIDYLDGTQAHRNAAGTHAGTGGDPDVSLETVNTTLTTTVTGAPITGQSLEAGGSGILGWLASIRKAITDNIGTTADAEAASGNGSLVGLLKRLRTLLDGSALTTATATIANAASLSGSVALSGKGIIRLYMPAAWTAANLTFQVSADNSTFYNLYDQYGAEYTVTSAVGNAIVLNPSDFMGINYIKVRSGTNGTPVTQGASRDIILITRPL